MREKIGNFANPRDHRSILLAEKIGDIPDSWARRAARRLCQETAKLRS
jgi:hypothetical protein